MLRRVLRPFGIGFLLSVCAFVLAGLNSLPTSSAADDKPDKEPPKTLTVDVGGGVKMEFVLLPKGKFTMGSPKDEKGRFDEEVQHEVEITRPFYLGKYPVTQEQYVAITRKENPSLFCKARSGTDKVKDRDTKQFPVETVTWSEATQCCDELRKNDPQKRPFRLPTEAEWEYACRAGTKTAYFFGDDAKDLGAYAWFADNSDARTHEVGTRKPNPWGLYDLQGNVYQWCEDHYGPYDGLRSNDPERIAKHGNDHRVVRGGSWYFGASDCRAACRRDYAPSTCYDTVGFRIAFRPD